MGRYSLHEKLKTSELDENANSKTAIIFQADHDKFFLTFHVQLIPHHGAGEKTEATNFHGKISWAFVA